MILLGTLSMILANVCGAVIATAVKVLGNSVPTAFTLLIQFAVCLILVTPLVLRHGWKGFYTKHPIKLASRAIIGALSFWLYYRAISLIPLVNATLLTLSGPIWVPLLGRVIIRESIPTLAWVGIGVGFFGMLIVMWPAYAYLNIGSFLALASGITMAVVFVMLRDLGKTENTSGIIFYYSLITALIMVPFSIHARVDIVPYQWGIIILLGVLIFALEHFMIFSFKQAPAGIMSSLTYLTVVFTGIIDWLYWDHIPGHWFIVGSLLIIFGGSWTILTGHYATKHLQ